MKYKKLPIDYKKNKENIEIGHVVRIVSDIKGYNGMIGIVYYVDRSIISLKNKNEISHRWSAEDLRKVYITDADIFLYHTHGHKAVLEELEKREKKKIKKMLKTRKKNAERNKFINNKV